MAKLPALISALAKGDDRERATIEHVARVIRESGYIPTTKRGRGSASMTSREAVNLLLGANGADAPKDAPLAIDRFRSLILSKAYSAETDLGTHASDFGEPMLDVFRQVMNSENFGVALEALIDGMPEVFIAALNCIDTDVEHEGARTLYREWLLNHSWHHDGDRPFSLTVDLRRYVAKIHCERMGRNEFTALFIMEGHRLMEGFYGRRDCDRSVTVSVSGLTLLRLARATLGDALEHEDDEYPAGQG